MWESVLPIASLAQLQKLHVNWCPSDSTTLSSVVSSETNILCTEKVQDYFLYLLATNPSGAEIIPSGASTTLTIHMPQVCQALRTHLLLWSPIPGIKLSVSLPVGHGPGMCFSKGSSACGEQAELTERGVGSCAFPGVWQRRGQAMALCYGQESTPSHRALSLRELWCKIPFLADTNMHKFLGVMWRMNHMLPHWTFAGKQFCHVSVDSAPGGEKSRKVLCASSDWQAVYKKTWNNSKIIIILSRSNLCPVFWVFYRWLKLWSKISSEGILKSSVFAVIVFL